jgi:hypothetical protein
LQISPFITITGPPQLSSAGQLHAARQARNRLELRRATVRIPLYASSAVCTRQAHNGSVVYKLTARTTLSATNNHYRMESAAQGGPDDGDVVHIKDPTLSATWNRHGQACRDATAIRQCLRADQHHQPDSSRCQQLHTTVNATGDQSIPEYHNREPSGAFAFTPPVGCLQT